MHIQNYLTVYNYIGTSKIGKLAVILKEQIPHLNCGVFPVPFLVYVTVLLEVAFVSMNFLEKYLSFVLHRSWLVFKFALGFNDFSDTAPCVDAKTVSF